LGEETRAAAFKGSFGLNVAFGGLSPTAVDLNPLCWGFSEVCGQQPGAVVERPNLPGPN